MRLGGRAAAAAEVLREVLDRGRPASAALSDWGKAHRFAGSGDRAAIGNLVYDVLRRRTSLGLRAGTDDPAHLAVAALVDIWQIAPAALEDQFAGDTHAPNNLASDFFSQLTQAIDPGALEVSAARADLPDWLWDDFADTFGDDALAEAEGLRQRAPLDLRVNTLKSDRQAVLKALHRSGFTDAAAGALADTAIRIAPPAGPGRTPNVQADAAFQRGLFEVQDEGSQIVGQLVFAQPGEQVLDICAGAGGKTLSLAAQMANAGQVFAFDVDRTRLAPIFDRVTRAGAHNVQVRQPRVRGAGNDSRADDPFAALRDLEGRMHRVVIDAPCTGSGVWRRRPDAKWKLTPAALEKRLHEQRGLLASARDFVRPGGYLCYITCSILTAENEGQIVPFLADNPDFELVSCEEVWRDLFGMDAPQPWSSDAMSVTLTPTSTGTDGFYFAVMQRTS
ncbi:MAG: RsmB/NOP family class I SAM-dependent RNA methyltransferase [Pseudomonadota bacterium]